MTSFSELERLDGAIDAIWTELTQPGADYETRSASIGGESLRVFVRAPVNMAQVWAETAIFADNEYLIYGDERITYGEAHRTVAKLVSYMEAHGVGAGDHVAIAMRNCPEWMLIFWACMSIGATAVGINAWWVPAELEFAFNDSRPAIIFCDDERYARLESWASRAGNVPVVVARATTPVAADSWHSVLKHPESATCHQSAPDDDACIFYTSGTTGFPKGARLTHRGCANTLLGIGFIREMAVRTGREPGSAPPTGFSAPTALITTPLFHVTANNCAAQPVTAAGGKVVLMRKWSAAEALRLIEAEGVTNVSGVPTMARELLSHPDLNRHDLSTLVAVSSGGASVPPDLVHRVAESNAPMQPSTGFGMTETCGLVSGISGPAFVQRPESCGRALPTFDVRIVDDDGTILRAGGVGELLVRGPAVIAGYLNQPEAKAQAIVDGWLRTGDIAHLDEAGYIFIVDRKKDMILRGGENIFCAEVEAAIYRHGDVEEVCVFGVPDDRLGETVGTAIVLKAGSTASAEELRGHAATMIAAYKLPQRIWIMDERLPRNATGKFLRRALRDALESVPPDHN